MQLQLDDIETGSELTADICIVGAGAAGITLARRFDGTTRDVLLLEGGTFEPTAKSQDLYKGRMITAHRRGRDKEYLERSRLRYFGGTTNHWTGWCRSLDAIDFEVRSWIPHSGWPITRETLDPWYDEAAPVLGIAPFKYKMSRYARSKMPALEYNGGRAIVSHHFHYNKDGPRRLGTLHREEIVESKNVRLLLDANVTAIHTGKSGEQVKRLEVTSVAGKRFKIRPQHVILATGGVENARLLLASNAEQQAGIGNQNDLVGRFFSDHPHSGNAGVQLFTDPEITTNFSRVRAYGRPRPDPISRVGATRATLGFAEEYVREHELLQVSMQIKERGTATMNELDKAVAYNSRALDHDVLYTERVDPGLRHHWARYPSTMFLRAEPLPDPNNRVKLISTKDALGMPRVSLNWKMSRSEIDSMERFMTVLAKEMGVAGFGRIMDTFGPKEQKRYLTGGFHHMGTTRMHDDPKQGVVDADCKVHGVANLYIAGSSVFTTCGFANPTYTIVALALRLADHMLGDEKGKPTSKKSKRKRIGDRPTKKKRAR